MSLAAGFNQLLKLQSRSAKLVRQNAVPPDSEYDISMAPSNYSRNLAGPENTSMSGKEWVISKQVLVNAGFTDDVRRGDILLANNDRMRITEVIPMPDLGGVYMGFRVRTE